MKATLTLLCFTVCAVSALDVRTSRINKLKPENRLYGIEGGQEIHVEKSPYVVALLKPTNSLLGSGSLVDAQWVLTAGIVVLEVSPSDLRVRIGSDKALSGGSSVTVEKVVFHPGYNGSWKNDLALVKLSSPLKATKKSKPILLASTLPKAGAKTVVTGYGPTSFSLTYDGRLRAANVPFIPYEKCKDRYRAVEPDFSSLNFCASKDGVGACPLDWGAPLQYKNKLIGIFSGAFLGCGTDQYPGAYADITQYRKWIKETIGH